MTTTATALGRCPLRARDRLDGTFGEAPPDEQLSLAHVLAWETYCVGRLQRYGLTVHEPRWRYNFRNRHGFTDDGDAAFDRLWTAEHLTWHDSQPSPMAHWPPSKSPDFRPLITRPNPPQSSLARAPATRGV